MDFHFFESFNDLAPQSRYRRWIEAPVESQTPLSLYRFDHALAARCCWTEPLAPVP